jgi:hypothetical protein
MQPFLSLHRAHPLRQEAIVSDQYVLFACRSNRRTVATSEQT